MANAADWLRLEQHGPQVQDLGHFSPGSSLESIGLISPHSSSLIPQVPACVFFLSASVCLLNYVAPQRSLN